MVEAQATARYIRTSAQKAKLVLDQIRGKSVDYAMSMLKFTRKAVARDIEKVLRSAVANAQQKEGFGGDTDRLFVSACYAGQGPSFKRVRPAPMGRAFRVLKRTAHLTVHVAERPERKRTAPAPTTGAGGKTAAGKAGTGKATSARGAAAKRGSKSAAAADAE